MKYTAILMICFLFTGFRGIAGTETDQGTDGADIKLFEVLESEATGIRFQNELTDNLEKNSLIDVYHYNGSGVAVADFNNDGLQDVYFVSALYKDQLYLNIGNLRFRDVSAASGITDTEGFQTGITTVDINSDGWTDIYLSVSGVNKKPEQKKNKLFINGGANKEGIPVFSEQSSEYNLDLSLNSTQAAFFDYDRDGDLDMFLVNHLPDDYGLSETMNRLGTKSDVTGDRLYENRDGKYYEVSERAGLVNNSISCMLGLGISDLNNDGWPDVYASNDFPGKDYFYVNNGDGTFTESIDKTMKHISYASMGNDLADFNNDGLIDIVTLDMTAEDNYSQKASMGIMNETLFETLVGLGLHHQYMYNALQVNNGISPDVGVPVFSDVGQMTGITSTDWSWSPLLFDMDNDGFKDLFIANGIKGDLINVDYLQYKNQKFQELVEGKIDESGFVNSVLERMPERPRSDYFFRNKGNLNFEKMNGTWSDNVATCSNGTAYADLDNDGDLDIIVNNSFGPSFIYRNKTRENNLGNYIQIELDGPEKNPLGIGTRVIIRQEKQSQVQELHLNRGFQSSVSPVIHFGLGTDKKIKELEVIWPDGKKQLLKNLKVNQKLKLSYSKANLVHDYSYDKTSLFADANKNLNFMHKHVENEFNDFQRESLIPHKMSNLGPALAVADVNADGFDDIYIGGAATYSGMLYLQSEKGFTPSGLQPWKEHAEREDVKAAFFDADGDDDLDLYVVSGSNEFGEGTEKLQDRLYINTGNGIFEFEEFALPGMMFSGSCVEPFDFDRDGDADLFIGGRQKPGQYPVPVSSFLLRNDSEAGSVRFTDVSLDLIPQLEDIGMVTDAKWTDINADGKTDLVIVGEWMEPRIFVKTGEVFEEQCQVAGLSTEIGWWNCVESADMDGDGDIDLVAGNLGINYKYKASPQLPFEIYAKDFDNSGTFDIVLGYYNDKILFPVRGRSCSSNQMPFIKQKFPTYDAFGKATLIDVYGPDNLETALHYKVTNFASCYFENQGDGTFLVHRLPNQAQVSSVNGLVIRDINADGHQDILIAGNLYGSEAETPRNDAGIGLLLMGDGAGKFTAVPAVKSGLYIEGDVKDIQSIRIGADGSPGIIAAKNNGKLQLVRINQK